MQPSTPIPQQPNQTPQTKDDAYASTLAKMEALNYELEQKSKPEQKHFIPKKVIIYVIISLIFSFILYIAGSLVFKDNPATENTSDTTKQLLNAAQEIKDLQ